MRGLNIHSYVGDGKSPRTQVAHNAILHCRLGCCESFVAPNFLLLNIKLDEAPACSEHDTLVKSVDANFRKLDEKSNTQGIFRCYRHTHPFSQRTRDT